MIIDINMHHLPQNLFNDEKMLDAFISTAPRGYGEVAYVDAVESGRQRIVLEKPKGYHNLHPGSETRGHGRRRG
jgi:hypothetical protein